MSSEGLKLLIDPVSTSPLGLFYSWANQDQGQAAEKFQVEGNYSLAISWLVYCLWRRIPIFFNSSGKCLREHSPLWWYSSSTSWYNTWGKTKDIYFKVLKAFYKSKRCVHGNLILLKRKSSISAIDISSHMSVNKGTKARLGKKDKYKVI